MNVSISTTGFEEGDGDFPHCIGKIIDLAVIISCVVVCNLQIENLTTFLFMLHYSIDSSLLLSPKADFQLPMSGENAEITSQEVPNFLSGIF